MAFSLSQQDREARVFAQTEFERPVVVEAGAGTGKTTTLVARVLAWCLGPGWARAEASASVETSGGTGAAPQERRAADILGGVVAITFTEAAAAEMAARIGGALASLAAGEAPPPWLDVGHLPEAAQLRRRAAALAATLDHLTVRTIHAFCRGLLADHPLEAGLHPNLTVDADGLLLDRIARETVEAALPEAYGDPADPAYLGLAVAGLGPEDLVTAVTTLADRGLKARELEADPFGQKALEALGHRLERILDDLARSAAPLEAVQRTPAARAALDALEASRELLHAGDFDREALEAFRNLWPESLPRLQKWSQQDLGKLERGCLEDEDSVAQLSRSAGRAAALLSHLSRLDPQRLDHARKALAPLLARVEERLRSEGVATFGSLLTEARDLLTGSPGVRRRLQGRIDQLLVDEFQDTDAVQCELIAALALEESSGEGSPASPPGLFLVGDPKQSIYGWRSADLAAYDAFLERVRRAGGLVHSLSVNFRSVPEILDEVERAIAPVMKEQTGLQPAFEALVASDAPTPFPETGLSSGGWRPVEYWISWATAEGGGPGTRTTDAATLEAEAIARDLLRLRRETGLSWSEAGILFRSTGDLDIYLEALRSAGIPFAVGRDKEYYRRREIIEAAALVRAVLDPGDHLALLTLLRSPMVGVPDAALVPLWSEGLPALMTRLEGPDPEALDRLTQMVESVLPRLAALAGQVPGLDRIDGWHHALLAAGENLGILRGAFRREPAEAFVARLRQLFLQEVLESARYLGRHRLANLERFYRQLLSTLEISGDDVSTLLRMLRTSVARAEEAEEGKLEDGSRDAVQVLTIHRAKGLDFEHVYLVQAHRRSRGERAEDVDLGTATPGGSSSSASRREYCLFGASTLGFDRVLEQRRAVASAERVRLLYVALTRAKRRLVVAGTWPGEPRQLAPEQASTFLDLLEHRQPAAPDLGRLFEQGLAAPGGTVRALDESGGAWIFPGFDGTQEPASQGLDTPAPKLQDTGQIARQEERLARLRTAAQARSSRPWSSTASGLGHPESPPQAPVAEPATDRPARTHERPLERSLAMAVGTVVHRALEDFDLNADPAQELERQIGRLPAHLAHLLAAEGLGAGSLEVPLAEATAAAQGILRELENSALLARLRDLAEHIVARELPLLVPPGADPEMDRAPAEGTKDGEPLGFVAGTLDLLYRDPDQGGWVVADYKTDTVAGEALEARARSYSRQGEIYQRAVQEVLGLDQPPRFELWFLTADTIVELG